MNPDHKCVLFVLVTNYSPGILHWLLTLFYKKLVLQSATGFFSMQAIMIPKTVHRKA